MKKTVILLFLVFLYKSADAQNIVTDIITNGDISHLDNKLDIKQIINYKGNDLRILRNTIFAKYGYKFISEDLTADFSQFSWYDGNKDNVTEKFTSVDWANIQLINRLENAKNVFSIDDFTKIREGEYYLKSGRECIIFNQLYDDELRVYLPDNGLLKHIESFNTYMDFIGYNCKDILINAYKKDKSEWLRHPGNVNDIWYDEWYANLWILDPIIAIEEDGQRVALFLIYTRIDNDFAGRFDLAIKENEIVRLSPFGRE